MKISHFPNNLPTNNNLVYPQVLSAIKSTDTLVENDFNADVALIWSVLWFGKMSGNKRVWNHYRSKDKPVVVIEVGGLMRNETWKLGINGINNDADFGLDIGYDDSRLAKLNLSAIYDWKKNGDYIVIAGQHGYSEQWKDMPDMDTYYRKTILDIRKHSDLPIVIRSHPRFRERIHFPIQDKLRDANWYKEQNCEWNTPQQIANTYDNFNFEDQLRHTKCVYSYSSNAGLTSIINGVPAVVSKHSLAYDVGSSDINNLQYPNRSEWLKRLSFIEWFADEIDVQWKRIRSKL
jgi:hypothetical protein